MITFVKRLECPICKNDSTRQLIQLSFVEEPISKYLKEYYGDQVPVQDLNKGQYSLQECTRCGFIYQQEILGDTGMDLLYSQWINADASLNKKVTAGLDVRTGYARQCSQVIKAVGLPPYQIRVLDFGMGWGSWLLMAKAFGMQTEGLEIAEARVELAHKNGLKVVPPADIEDSSYHFINAEQVLEHVSDPLGVMASCYQWLKPGGFLRIAVPDGVEIEKRIQNGSWKVAEMPSIPLEHINIFTPKSLSYLANQQHFKVVHAPLVLPMAGFSLSEVKQWVGTLLVDLATRARIVKRTIVWLQK